MLHTFYPAFIDVSFHYCVITFIEPHDASQGEH
jgi:hypothetical protein